MQFHYLIGSIIREDHNNIKIDNEMCNFVRIWAKLFTKYSEFLQVNDEKH